MEQKENLFNKTSLRIEKRVEQLFKDTFSILTELDFNTKEFSEKEKNLLSSLIDYHSDEILFGFIKEKIYEFCKNNKDNVITYDDNGIGIKSKDLEEGIPVSEIFVQLYKYLVYVEDAYQITNSYLKDKTEGKEQVKSIFASNQSLEFEHLSTREMDDEIQKLSELIFKSINTYNFDYQYLAAFDSMFKCYTDIQQYILYVYLEALCHTFNCIRHNPEIFEKELGISINDLYSEKYIHTAFLTRDRIILNHYNEVKDFGRTYRAGRNELPFDC